VRTSNNVSRLADALDLLRTKLLEMGSLVETAIERSIRGVIERDPSAAEEVLAAETRINAIELEIDALAIELLALHQPMASNLRLFFKRVNLVEAGSFPVHHLLITLLSATEELGPRLLFPSRQLDSE
jgi:phosphate transport system protein